MKIDNDLQVPKLTSQTLKYIATCANEYEFANVQKLSCADVRSLLAEHAALVAVAEAAARLPQWIGRAMAEHAFDSCVAPNGVVGDLARIEQALANLAQVRKQ